MWCIFLAALNPKALSTNTYFLACVFVSHHQNIERPSANTKKGGRSSIHTPLCRRQCVGRWTCPRKVRTSLRVHPSDTGAGPTEVNERVFTWRSYFRHVTTCPTWIKNFLSIDLLGVMPKTQHTNVHVETVSSIKRTWRKYAWKWRDRKYGRQKNHV